MDLFSVTLFASSGINIKVVNCEFALPFNKKVKAWGLNFKLVLPLSTKVKAWAVWADSSEQAKELGLLECERIWSSTDGNFNHKVSIQIIPRSMISNENANIIASSE